MEYFTTDITVIAGRKTSGKSVFLKWLTSRFTRKLVWDYNHEHSSSGKVTHDLKTLFSLCKRTNPMKIVFQPFDKSEESFNEFCRQADLLSNYVLVIEEVERYATSHMIPENFAKIVDTGRHKGIGIVATCRRPREICLRLPSNADHIFLFQQHLPQDIEFLVDWVGAEAEKLKTAEQYSFLHYDARKGTTVLFPPLPYKGVATQ